ncbi:MAG TPA: DUF4328 domain-containing protein, partial [Polyangia bacterium]
MYRPLGPVATALSVAVVAHLAAQRLLVGLAERQAWLATMVAAVVLSLVLVYRAGRNLDVLGDGHARFSAGQCVGWFLIPVVNL